MSAGKGDKPRKVDGEKYRSNYDKIFRKDNFLPSETSKAAKKTTSKNKTKYNS